MSSLSPTSMLNYTHRKFPQTSKDQEPERGRSRTPKPTRTIDRLERRHNQVHKRIPRDSPNQIAHFPHSAQAVRRSRTPTRISPKGRSRDHSEPDALAIHQACARGGLRQCLQWMLEMQGVYLDSDDPRLDTASKDDLHFPEQMGLTPDATLEERQMAKLSWTTRRAEDDDRWRMCESRVNPEDKGPSTQDEDWYEVEQKTRATRAQLFRTQGMDEIGPMAPLSWISPMKPKRLSTLSHSLDSPLQRPYPIPRTTTHSRGKSLFPVDESELSTVRSMWLDQGRKGFALVEVLVQPSPPSQGVAESASFATATPKLCRNSSSDGIAASASISTSLSSSAPSALFSSVLTSSTATTISTALCSPSTTTLPAKSSPSPPCTKRAAATATLSPVSLSECPLHTYVASASLRQSPEDEVHRRKESIAQSFERAPPRRSRAVSTSWLSRGTKAMGGLVDLVGRLPAAYLPFDEHEASSLRTASCPPSKEHFAESEISLYLLPLRPPSYPLAFPPLPTLPRSPYRPLTPPPRPTPRPRFVPNPQFLRLKALHNRVLWGLLPVPRAECDALADIARRHQSDTCPGRPDVDRFGQLFTAKEALLRFAVEGAGSSPLSDERRVVVGASEEGARTWSWWRSRV